MAAVSKEWADRADLPPHVVNMLNNFPSNLHPMAQFSAAITALNSESKFAKGYSEGVPKAKYWEVRSHIHTLHYCITPTPYYLTPCHTAPDMTQETQSCMLVKGSIIDFFPLPISEGRSQNWFPFASGKSCEARKYST